MAFAANRQARCERVGHIAQVTVVGEVDDLARHRHLGKGPEHLHCTEIVADIHNFIGHKWQGRRILAALKFAS
jgi:hypothetical protein